MKRKAEGKSVNQRESGGAYEICYVTKLKALELFRSGCGYKKVSKELGLKVYTVRDWGRRFHKGDCEWAIPKDGKPRKKYDKEIKELAIAAYGRGTMSLTEICSLYSIPRKDTLVIWIRDEKRERANQAYGDNAGRTVSGEAAEMEGCGDRCSPALSGAGTGEQGKRPNNRGYLKKNTFLEVQRLAEEKGLTIKEACAVAGCSRSGYYKSRKGIGKLMSDMELVGLMRKIQYDEDVHQTYGAKRLTAAVNRALRELRKEDVDLITNNKGCVNHKRVERLAAEYDLNSIQRRRTQPKRYYENRKYRVSARMAENVLGRQFSAVSAPFSVYATDVTYLPCKDKGFIYLSTVMDICTQEILGFCISSENSVSTVMDSLAMIPDELLAGTMIHSDQGSPYFSSAWIDECSRLGITRSMSARGQCWDNAVMENFFSRMKCELNITKRSRMQKFSAHEIENKVRRYIGWYNNKRIQKKLGYMSPVEFRNLKLKELEDAKLII